MADLRLDIRSDAEQAMMDRVSEPCGQRGPGGDCPTPAKYLVHLTHLLPRPGEPVDVFACEEHTAELREFYPAAVTGVELLTPWVPRALWHAAVDVDAGDDSQMLASEQVTDPDRKGSSDD